MTEIPLTGLSGSSPLGALAAFGLLRLFEQIPELHDSRLSWALNDDWTAILHLSSTADEKNVCERLSAYARSTVTDIWGWNDSIRVPPDFYEQVRAGYLEDASALHRLPADFFAAFGSEAVLDNKGRIRPTEFDMTSGQQTFLGGFSRIHQSLSSANGNAVQRSNQAFEEALFQGWTYKDEFHSLGWDPSTERMHGLRHKAPTNEKAICVRAAVWLGFHALPLFPAVASRGRLAITGFPRRDRKALFTWPIWDKAIGVDTLRSLLAAEELAAGDDGWKKLAKRGVRAVYQSARSEFGQGYAVFRPATLVFMST